MTAAAPHRWMKTLRAAVRAEIWLAFQHEGIGRPREIARRVCRHYIGTVSFPHSRLIENAITDMVRNEIKKGPCVPAGKVQILILAGFHPLLMGKLPSAISIPRGPQDEEETFYRPLLQASLAELQEHLHLLRAQIIADRQRFHALQELHDFAVAMGASPAETLSEIWGREVAS